MRFVKRLLSGMIRKEVAEVVRLDRGLMSDHDVNDGTAGIRLGQEVKELSVVSGTPSTVTPDFTQTFMNVVYLTEDVTINFPLGIKEGDTYILFIKHTGGPWNVTWHGNYEWLNGGLAPTVSGSKDIVTFVSDDTGALTGALSQDAQ